MGECDLPECRLLQNCLCVKHDDDQLILGNVAVIVHPLLQLGRWHCHAHTRKHKAALSKTLPQCRVRGQEKGCEGQEKGQAGNEREGHQG